MATVSNSSIRASETSSRMLDAPTLPYDSDVERFLCGSKCQSRRDARKERRVNRQEARHERRDNRIENREERRDHGESLSPHQEQRNARLQNNQGKRVNRQESRHQNEYTKQQNCDNGDATEFKRECFFYDPVKKQAKIGGKITKNNFGVKNQLEDQAEKQVKAEFNVVEHPEQAAEQVADHPGEDAEIAGEDGSEAALTRYLALSSNCKQGRHSK